MRDRYLHFLLICGYPSSQRCNKAVFSPMYILASLSTITGLQLCVSIYVICSTALTYRSIFGLVSCTSMLYMDVGTHREARTVFFNYSPPWFLREGLSLNLELMDSARLAGPQGSVIFLSLPLQWQHAVPHPAFYMGARQMDSCPHTCKVSTFSNRPSPQPCDVCPTPPHPLPYPMAL